MFLNIALPFLVPSFRFVVFFFSLAIFFSTVFARRMRKKKVEKVMFAINKPQKAESQIVARGEIL